MSILDNIRSHAEAIAKSVPGVREHWLAIGELYLTIEREYMQTHSCQAVNGKALGKARKEWREGDASPETIGLRPAAVSDAVVLARWRLAVEVFFRDHEGKSADPTQLVKDWKRWAVEIRKNEGGGKFTREVKEKYFPGIPDNAIGKLFPPAKADPDVIRKIWGLSCQAEDQEGTPEGNAFLEKAESMAENLGLTLQEAREQYVPEPTALDQENAIKQIRRRLFVLSRDYMAGVMRAAALYILEHNVNPQQIDRVIQELAKEEEC